MSQEQNNLDIKEIVKEVVREELEPELKKIKQQQTQHLQEGNMYLNE